MLHDQKQLSAREGAAVKSILVVEDDADIGEFLVQAVLQETRYQAMLVKDGFQALKAITTIKPDLFILDYQLPGMDGIELYDQLHAAKGLEDVPAIMISARLPRRELEKRGLYSMHKPLELDAFLHLVDQLLSA